ncbi:uncharacterized protein LOC142982349 [Anticarsia gemmatalis]|uniref:uncharacterized protein LOC142982349 n=1 Tax=Anticarsia gemmatalis TaxID=129554 RepID=UPI003F77345A
MNLFISYVILQVLSITILQGNCFENGQKIDELLSESHESKAEVLENEPKKHKVVQKYKKNTVENLDEYFKHIKEKGEAILKDTGVKIIKEIKVESKNLTDNFDIVIKEYEKRLLDYLNDVLNSTKTIKYKDFILVDLCEFACRLIHNQKLKLLNETAIYLAYREKQFEAHTKEMMRDKIHDILNTFYNESKTTKSEEMQYICHVHDVCRPYPGFTDDIGFLIYSIEKLQDKKIVILVNILSVILKTNPDFVDTVSKIKGFKKLLNQIVGVTNFELKVVKEYLSLAKDVLGKKFTIIRKIDDRRKRKAIALRKFLDLLDQVFDHESNYNIFIDYEYISKSLTSWANDELQLISSVAQDFVNKVILKLKIFEESNESKIKQLFKLIEILCKRTKMNDEL